MLNQLNSVAYVSPGWPLSHCPNGIVSYIQNLIEGFDQNIEASVLSNGPVVGERSRGVVDLSSLPQRRSFVESFTDKVLYRIDLQYARERVFDRQVIKTARRISQGVAVLQDLPDIIELEESFGVGHTLMKELSIPVVTRLHGPWFLIGNLLTKKSSSYNQRVKSEGRAIFMSHGVTSPSYDVLNRVREFYDLDLPDARVIPNPIKATPKEVCWNFDSVARQSILFVGRFDSIKGADIAVAAFRLIALKNKDVEFIFVGPDRGIEIKGEQYSLSRYLKTFVPEANIRSRVKILGHCSIDQVVKLRRTASVTIITSRYENFPMSLLEALSAGCPTVGVAVGGIKEIITDGYNGLLAEPESAESVAEKSLALLNDSEKMENLSKNAMKDCDKKYSPKAVAKQMEEYYSRILGF